MTLAGIRSYAADGGLPTILYVDCNPHSGIDRRRLAGLRRYAAACGKKLVIRME